MHPRNRYRDHPLNITELAKSYPPLQSFLHPTKEDPNILIFDAKQKGSIYELVKAQFRIDFGIENWCGVPEGYLIPSVTRSLNYLHFMEDLVQEVHDKSLLLGFRAKHVREDGDPVKRQRDIDDIEGEKESSQPDREISTTVEGIDIGVGASCVFPILGCALNANWKFVGIDVDKTALEWARENASVSGFSDRINIVEAPAGSAPKLVECLQRNGLSQKKYGFVMCNPPFFDSPPDILEERQFGGTTLERSCPGGEVAFVSGLIDESVQLKQTIIWFTTMLGIKESLTSILSRLHHEASAETIRTYRLEQGHKFRWVVAWSFQKELCQHAIHGHPILVDNLEQGEVLQTRVDKALSELRFFTKETGICGEDGYRFRLKIKQLHAENQISIDALDIKGGEDAEKRAISCMKKVEQLITRKSRRWKKRAQRHHQKQHYSDQEE
jgi:23S rRNA (adenine1618-N6)-methyltransferase